MNNSWSFLSFSLNFFLGYTRILLNYGHVKVLIKFCCQYNEENDVNRDFHIASSLISQSSFFEEVRYFILASSQRKLCGYIAFFKFDVTVKKIKKFKFV